jgi:hypothetical protein
MQGTRRFLPLGLMYAFIATSFAATLASDSTYANSQSVAAATSSAALWGAFGGKVICGLAIHAQNRPSELVLCFAKPIPAPKGGIGDPGFVFLRATGRPQPTRLSQYTWERPDGWQASHRAALRTGQTWSAIGVTCSLSATAVRCTNRSHHGFTITRSSYRGF